MATKKTTAPKPTPEKEEEVTPEALPCGISQEQLDQWKDEYEKVYVITVDADGNGKRMLQAIFRKPGLEEMGLAAIHMTGTKKNPVASGNVIFDSCWLTGDPEIKKDPELKMSAMGKLGQVFKIRQATIKNL